MTLVWAGAAVVLTAFDGSVVVLALPAIANDFHASTPALSDLGSVLAIGSLGALPLATLADRFGRRRLIAGGVAGFSLANFASAFAPTLADLALLRLIAVCFEVLVAGVATALVVEEAPNGQRGRAVSVLALLSGIGTGVTVIAYPIIAPHWRWLFLAGGVGVPIAPLIWWLLPEGKTWLGVRITGSAVRLLMQPPWRRRVIVLAGMTALLAVLLEPAGLLFTVYATRALSMSPVAISTLIVVSGVAAATSLSFATGAIGFFIGNVLWSAFASAATHVFGAWSAELYPTRARATAEAASAVAASVGSIAGLQFVAVLSATTGLGGAIELGGIAAVVGALLLFLLPETKQQPLPE